MTAGGRLWARGLTAHRGGRLVLAGLDLDVAPGECVVILGMSGSGKSTLVRLLSGLDTPHEGQVRVEGRLGLLTQEPALFDFDRLTISDNIQLAIDASQASASQDLTAPPTVAGLLESVGLDPGLGAAAPGGLSGGQRRRAGLARALAARPTVLIYDEPTAGLDLPTTIRVAQLIRSTCTGRSLTSVVITHDHEVAVRVADRALVLDASRGQLVAVPWPADFRPGSDEAADHRVRAALVAAASEAAATPGAASTVSGAGLEPQGDGMFTSMLGALGEATALLSGMGRVAREGAVSRRVGDLLPGTVAMVAVGALAVGLVVAIQASASLARFEARHLLPEVATTSTVRHVLPLLTALLMAGRVGASVAAEVGAYRLGGQLDALRLLGLDPRPFLASPILWAMLAVAPLATLAGLGAGLGGLILGASVVMGLKPALVLSGVAAALRPADVAMALFKSLVFGLAIAQAAYRHGARPKSLPAHLGRDTTGSVVEASLAVVLLDSLMTQVAGLLTPG